MGKIKLCLPNDSSMGVGGGWTFRDNLIKGSSMVDGFEIVDEDEANMALIAGATMILPETLSRLKKKMPVILRLDGVPEDWRNGGRGWDRLKNTYYQADGVICQSYYVRSSTYEWLEQVVGVEKKMAVIMNGVDKTLFRPSGESYARFGEPSILHVNSRKDPNKRIEEVIAEFRELKLRKPKATLTLVGKYPTYLRKYDFGLYDMKKREDWQYMGIVKEPEEMAKIMRSVDEFWFPSFADPCPNVLIEALHCLGLSYVKMINEHGGAIEIVEQYKDDYDFGLDVMAEKYYKFMKRIGGEDGE